MDDDGLGYTGIAQAWSSGDTKQGGEHIVWIRMGTPLGFGLHITFDPHPSGAGAWSFSTVKACNEVNPGILELVNAWAAECWKRLREAFPEIHSSGDNSLSSK